MMKVILYSKKMNYGMDEMIMMMLEWKMTNWIEFNQLWKSL